MEINQNGFAAMGIILTVVAVLIFGGTGVWYLNQTAKPKPAPMVSEQPVQPKTNSQPELNQPGTPVVPHTQEPAASETQGAASHSQATTQPSADDISGWQTYRNEKCGYEIKYPAEYNPVENDGNVSFLNAEAMKCYRLGNRAGKDCIDYSALAYINCSLSKDFLNGASSIEDYITQGVKSASFSPNFTPKAISVGNSHGIEAEGMGYAGAYKDIYLQKGDYIIQFEVQKEGNGVGVGIFDKMVSSFKVVGSNQPTQAENQQSKALKPTTPVYNGWQIYSDPNLWGFEIEYPKDIYLVDNTCKAKLNKCDITFKKTNNPSAIPSIAMSATITTLTAKDFVSKYYGESYRTKGVKNIAVGPDRMPGVECTIFDSDKLVVVKGQGDILFGFIYWAKPNGEIDEDIFNQILSTFRIVGSPMPFTTRDLSAKEYQLNYPGSDLFTGDGPITVREILNCSVPDLSTKCPETSFIGEQNCKNIISAPADCANDGTPVGGNASSCLYEGFSGVAAGTIVTGYYGLSVRNNRCFLIGWGLIHHNCDMFDEPYKSKCLEGDSQRVANNKKMLFDFKFNGPQK
jgi:hypothetical protein